VRRQGKGIHNFKKRGTQERPATQASATGAKRATLSLYGGGYICEERNRGGRAGTRGI